MMSLLDGILAASRDVCRQARHVHLDQGRISAYAASLPIDRASSAELDPRYHFLGSPVQTVAFILTLDAINFGSGYFPHLRKLPGLSGYFTVASHLTERFRAHGPFTAQQLASMSGKDCTALFRQEPDSAPVSELMELFAKALNQLGRYLMDKFGGEFEGLAGAAGGSAERLVGLLASMDYFRDIAQYGEREIPFFKRAQLTAADLSLALRGEGWGRFTDLQRLTIFADNLVPHVLRVDGILVYERDLSERIDAGRLIPAGSEEEVEIRAGAVHAVELLVQQLHGRNQEIRALDLDYLLWNRGQGSFYKARPRHRTRTVFY